ncbi:MAG TPA: hypothetical protein DIU15_02905, partial [Deltaproteobacteria bacterium]|nr:hypothetical protein [Deltaproteobacteria bacterium]
DDTAGDDGNSAAVCGGPLVSVSEAEPNNFWGSPNTFDPSGGDIVISGTISSCANDGSTWTGEEDWFVVQSSCGSQATVQLSWVGGSSDLDVWVADASGSSLLQLYSWGYSGPEVGSTTLSGDTVFMVACWDGQPADYVLTIDWDNDTAVSDGDDDDD